MQLLKLESEFVIAHTGTKVHIYNLTEKYQMVQSLMDAHDLAYHTSKQLFKTSQELNNWIKEASLAEEIHLN